MRYKYQTPKNYIPILFNKNMSELTESFRSIEVEIKQIVDFNCIERFTECPLCFEQFKEPRILPCKNLFVK